MKNSIKYTLLFSAIIMLSPSLISCNKDDESLDTYAIMGTWFNSYSTYEDPSGYEFLSDGTGTNFYKTSKWKFTWSLVNNTLTITHENTSSLDASLKILNIYNDRMVVANTETGSSRTLYRHNQTGGISNGGNNTSSGAPASLSGKTLNLYKSDGSYLMGIYHSNGNKANVNLYNNVIVSASYPPTYSYKASGNSATYSMTFVTETYVPYYGTYTYSQFTEDITLTFNSLSTGAYSGKQTNMMGGTKNISGNFDIQ